MCNIYWFVTFPFINKFVFNGFGSEKKVENLFHVSNILLFFVRVLVFYTQFSLKMILILFLMRGFSFWFFFLFFFNIWINFFVNTFVSFVVVPMITVLDWLIWRYLILCSWRSLLQLLLRWIERWSIGTYVTKFLPLCLLHACEVYL